MAGSLTVANVSGVVRRIRDNALITIGRTHTEITAALLHTPTTSRLAAAGHDHADLFARLGKAVGVDIAYRAAIRFRGSVAVQSSAAVGTSGG
jgi:hypothetical protein